MDLFDLGHFEKALEGALGFLGRVTPAGAKTRLLDIEVEEVSFVDRAANKRRFLTVKQRGDDMDKDKTKLRLSTTVKESLLAKLTKALEGLVPLCDAVKDAEVVADGEEGTTPQEMAAMIGKASDLLQEAVSVYPHTMSKSIEELLGALVTGTDELVKAVDGQELQPELAEGISKLATALGAVVKTKEPEPPAADPEPPAPEPQPVHQTDPAHIDIEAMSDDEFFTALDVAETELGGLGSEFMDKMKVLAAAMMRIAAAPDPVSLNNIRREMVGVLKAAKGIKASAAAPLPTDDANKRNIDSQVQPPPAEPGDLGNVGSGPTGDGPAKDKSDGELGNILKSISALEKKVEKMASTPQAPASRTEDGGGKGNGQQTNARRPSGGRWVL